MRVYLETSVIAQNIRRHPLESKAMRQLENYSKAGVLEMVTSRVTLRETERTKDEQTRRNLKEDSNNLTPVAEDEKVLGFQTLQDQYGGSISYPLVSDVQDEKTFPKSAKMEKIGENLQTGTLEFHHLLNFSKLLKQ